VFHSKRRSRGGRGWGIQEGKRVREGKGGRVVTGSSGGENGPEDKTDKSFSAKTRGGKEKLKGRKG